MDWSLGYPMAKEYWAASALPAARVHLGKHGTRPRPERFGYWNQPIDGRLCLPVPALGLVPDHQDQWMPDLPPLPTDASRDELIERIEWAGIAGMGGAGFPTHSKLATDRAIQTLIINIAECEPYISCDDWLTRHHSPDILAGAAWVARILKVQRILVGIEDNKPEAIAAMRQAIEASHLDVELWVCPTKYPSGGEKQLIQLLTGDEIPAGQLPASLGYHMHNPATLVAIRDAIEHGRH